MKIEKVEAFKITKDHIYFFCPYCEDKNLVDPYRKYCDIHIHGSNNNLFNRIEYRSPHCLVKNCDEFEIHITDRTFRC